MALYQILILAIIQGITEFLPISSSAHLILPSALLNFPDQGLAFDVAVHLGTLLAVVGYFRRDIWQLGEAWFEHCLKGRRTEHSDLAWMVVLATIPAGLAGLLLGDFIEQYLRSVKVIATTTIVFGVLLGVADKYFTGHKSEFNIGWKQALFIGAAQALALIPGTSRSGITMTAALGLGLNRVSAANFSFLMSIPIIVLSGAFKGIDLLEMDAVPWSEIIWGIALSATTAYACIKVFLAWINRVGMMPFVWYRIVLGLALFGLIAMGYA